MRDLDKLVIILRRRARYARTAMLVSFLALAVSIAALVVVLFDAG